MNTSIKIVSKRRNVLLDSLLNLFSPFYSHSTLLLEVFVKRNMGRRYFSIMLVITIIIILGVLPPVVFLIHDFLSGLANNNVEWDSYKKGNITWYLLIGAFAVASAFRWRETVKKPMMGLHQQTTYTGDSTIQSLLEKTIKKSIPMRWIETFFEPLIFLLIGSGLRYFDQPVGYVLIFASAMHFLSNVAAYRRADE